MDKKRFSWQGGIAVLLVAALILVGFWYFTKEEAPLKEEQGVPYILTLRCSQMSEDPFNGLKEGDTLYNLNRTEEIGTIRSIKLVDWEIEDFDRKTGQYITVTHPEDQLLELEVEVPGIRKDFYFKAGGVRLHLGQVFYPETDSTRLIATVWGIEEVA